MPPFHGLKNKGAVKSVMPHYYFLVMRDGLPSRDQQPQAAAPTLEKGCRHVYPGQLGLGVFPLHCLNEHSGGNMEKARGCTQARPPDPGGVARPWGTWPTCHSP